jgi:hypothetical protein
MKDDDDPDDVHQSQCQCSRLQAAVQHFHAAPSSTSSSTACSTLVMSAFRDGFEPKKERGRRWGCTSHSNYGAVYHQAFGSPLCMPGCLVPPPIRHLPPLAPPPLTFIFPSSVCSTLHGFLMLTASPPPCPSDRAQPRSCNLRRHACAGHWATPSSPALLASKFQKF